MKASLGRPSTLAFAAVAAAAALLPASACSSNGDTQGDGGLQDGGRLDATLDTASESGRPVDAPADVLVLPVDARPPSGTFCALPGSFVTTAQGAEMIPDPSHPTTDLSWLSLPVGFCAHYFSRVQMTRQLRFAPGGDLFVASPRTGTTGGSNNGIGIAVLPDDNHDGYADSVITRSRSLPRMCAGLPSTQGLMFGGYHQDDVEDPGFACAVPARRDHGALGLLEVVTTITSAGASTGSR